MAGDTSDDELPPLFEESAAVLAPAPKTLANEHGWKVVEEPLPDGGAMRWMVCEEAFSLDQTRVKLGPADSMGHRSVDRSELRATSHQLMALLVAMGPPGGTVAMLGGGGMAVPMALLARHQGQIHVVELHQVVIDFADQFFGAQHPQLVIHHGDALQMVAEGQLAEKLESQLSSFLVDVDFMRFPQVPETFLSSTFWSQTWSMMEPSGLVAVNVIGCEPQGLTELVAVATGHASAILVEAEDAELRTWTRMMPKAGVLILGPKDKLQQIHQGCPQCYCEELVKEVTWSLKTAKGPAGRCHWLK